MARPYMPHYLGAFPLMDKAMRFEANGQSKTIFEWSKATGIPEGTLRSRIKAGWPLDQVVSVPVRGIMGRNSHSNRRHTGGGSELSKKAPGPVGLVRSTSNLNRVFENG